jgi:hypothetical protein
MVSLRRAGDRRRDVRRLPQWFETPDAELPLSPRHEASVEPEDPEAEATFRCLQRCNRVKLASGTPRRQSPFRGSSD